MITPRRYKIEIAPTPGRKTRERYRSSSLSFSPTSIPPSSSSSSSAAAGTPSLPSSEVAWNTELQHINQNRNNTASQASAYQPDTPSPSSSPSPPLGWGAGSKVLYAIPTNTNPYPTHRRYCLPHLPPLFLLKSILYICPWNFICPSTYLLYLISTHYLLSLPIISYLLSLISTHYLLSLSLLSLISISLISYLYPLSP